MSLIRTVPAIKEKIQSVMKDYQDAKDNCPAFEHFAEETRAELKQNYIKNLNEKTLQKLEDIQSDVSIKKAVINSTVNKKKFPATNSALLNGTQSEIIKQRAEQLAMNNLDSNVVSYLKSEVENNNLDFINYFRNAVKLNTSVSSELKSEMNQLFNDVDNTTGLTDLNNELALCSAYETKINSYKDVVNDDSPGKRMAFIYVDNDIQKLEKELKTDTI